MKSNFYRLTARIKSRTQGFTLVETLVAIAVLTIAIVGPFSSVQRALVASDTAREQLIASMLAQEGVEYIRNVRDDNYLGSRSWLTGLSLCQSDTCSIDPSAGDPNISLGTPIHACGSATSCPLYVSSANLYNQQNSGTITPFTRRVLITTVSATEVKVTVTVSYTARNVPYTVVVNENLQDWL